MRQPDNSKTTLHLLAGSAITAESLALFYEALTGKKANAENFRQAAEAVEAVRKTAKTSSVG